MSIKAKLTACVIAAITLAGCTAPPAPPMPAIEVIAPNITIKTSPAQWYRFHTDVLINGVSVNCLIDTGAAETIYLDKDTSIKAGINRVGLTFGEVRVKVTGEYKSDRATIKNISWGGFHHTDIKGIVMLSNAITKRGHPNCILGMEYLRNFKLVVVGDTMTISREG